MPDRSASQPETTRGGDCPRCGSRTASGDSYCRDCGAPLDGRDAARRLPVGARAIGLVIIGLALLFAFLHYGAISFRDPEPPAERIPVSGAGTRAGDAAARAVSPREAADRMFNDAMAALERGDTATARPWISMALTAYRGLDRLDADARYHLALLQLGAGDAAAALEHAEAILGRDPDHLLGLLGAAEALDRLGRPERAAALYRRYMENYRPERAASKPEYRDHSSALAGGADRARRYLDRRGGAGG